MAGSAVHLETTSSAPASARRVCQSCRVPTSSSTWRELADRQGAAVRRRGLVDDDVLVLRRHDEHQRLVADQLVGEQPGPEVVVGQALGGEQGWPSASSIGRPTSACVPALVTSKAPGRAHCSPSRRRSAAYGERQMLPVHTVRTRTFAMPSSRSGAVAWSAAVISPSA